MVNYIQKLKGAPIEVFDEVQNTSTSKIYGMKGHNSILVIVQENIRRRDDKNG